MSDTGFVGIDPALARDVADEARSVAETAGQMAADVAEQLAEAQIPDNGFASLSAEIVEELGLLDRLLSAKATEMELAAIGIFVDASADEAAALWASLTDAVGAGVDFTDHVLDHDATVTLSSSVAANMLAEYLGWMGDVDGLSVDDVRALVHDPSAPPEVRAAAQYFALNLEVWGQIGFAAHPVTGRELADFATTNAHLAVLAESYDRFDVAAEGGDTDGHVSRDDLEAVAGDTTGAFSDTDRAAARWLLDNPVLYEPWSHRHSMTDALFSRRVFSDDPAMAAAWLQQVGQDPGAYITDITWLDTMGGRAWLEAAVSSTSDSGQQVEIVLGFAAIYQATKPEPVSLLDPFHFMLDGLSFIDPTQLADALNAGLYALEGDMVNAGMSAAGILLPIGGGAAIRMGKEAVLGLAARQGDEVAEAMFKQAVLNGELTDDVVAKITKEIGDEFGDDAARSVREYLDDLRRTPDLDVGPGNWTTKNEAMSDRAREFQAAVTGAPPGTVYRHNGVDFDGYSNGVLIDAKGPGYAWPLKNGEWPDTYRGKQEFLNAAERQTRAAGDTPIRWVVAEPETADALRRLLAREGYDHIEIVG